MAGAVPGRERAGARARTSPGRSDAQRWLDEVTTSVVTGQYVDPKAGRVTFQEYAEQWRAAQVHRPTSQAHVESMLRRHVYPIFGARPMSVDPAVRDPGVGQAARHRVTSAKRKPLAPATIGVVHGVVSAVMKAAVRDRRIVANPCEGTRLPRVERKRRSSR